MQVWLDRTLPPHDVDVLGRVPVHLRRWPRFLVRAFESDFSTLILGFQRFEHGSDPVTSGGHLEHEWIDQDVRIGP